MAKNLFGKAADWAKSPQGRKVIAEAGRRARQAAEDPATRVRLEKVRDKLVTRGTPATDRPRPPTARPAGTPPPARGTPAPPADESPPRSSP